MDKIQLIPSHAIGAWLLNIIHHIFDFLGLRHSSTLEEIFYIAAVVLISLAIGWLVEAVVVLVMRKLVEMRHSEGAKEMLQMHVMSKCAHFIPPLVFLGLIPIAFNSGHHLLDIIERIVGAYTVITFAIGLTAIARFVFFRYNKRQNTKGLPIKGILNILLGAIWIVMTIIAISIIVDKSPAYLLTGLGAFAAALMLIFKDPILGFTAGIQMSQNDMLHVGDWIVVPGTPANGIVIDVTLSAVKIRNFDNTIVTVPPYTLVSTSFQNYRGMKDSGMRRFTRTFVIDPTTVVKLTPDMINLILQKHPEMQGFVKDVKESGKLIAASPGIRPVNGSLETNLGLYRAYFTQYLINSSWIKADSQILVRILDPTDNGIPLDIYAFTITTDWNEFEAIQSAIMEHVAISLPDFGLNIFNCGAYDITMVPQAAPLGQKAAPAQPQTKS